MFYLNFNADEDRFEMVSLYGNMAAKLHYVGQVDEGGRRLTLRNEPYLEEGVMRQAWAILSYDGEGGYVWRSGSGPEGSPEALPGGQARFIDTVVRMTPAVAP